MHQYRIKEIFQSIQGEGANAGKPAVFVRFAGCNLSCSVESVGWNCDTDFSSGQSMSAIEIAAQAEMIRDAASLVVLTGGEPALQVRPEIVNELHGKGLTVAIETNGTKKISGDVDYVAVSPKTAWDAIHLEHADELRCVVCHGQPVPSVPRMFAVRNFISPAWSDNAAETQANIAWAVHLVKTTRSHERWELSVQVHKLIGIR